MQFLFFQKVEKRINFVKLFIACEKPLTQIFWTFSYKKWPVPFQDGCLAPVPEFQRVPRHPWHPYRRRPCFTYCEFVKKKAGTFLNYIWLSCPLEMTEIRKNGNICYAMHQAHFMWLFLWLLNGVAIMNNTGMYCPCSSRISPWKFGQD